MKLRVELFASCVDTLHTVANQHALELRLNDAQTLKDDRIALGGSGFGGSVQVVENGQEVADELLAGFIVDFLGVTLDPRFGCFQLANCPVDRGSFGFFVGDRNDIRERPIVSFGGCGRAQRSRHSSRSTRGCG